MPCQQMMSNNPEIQGKQCTTERKFINKYILLSAPVPSAIAVWPLRSGRHVLTRPSAGPGTMGELGQKVFDYAVKTREQEDFNEAQRKTNEYVDTMAKINRDWQAGVTGENARDAPKRFAA